MAQSVGCENSTWRVGLKGFDVSICIGNRIKNVQAQVLT